jgi:hypothetical protein
MNPIENFSSKERGLLSVASRHKSTVGYFKEKVVPYIEAGLVKAWKKNFCEEDVWDYIENASWGAWVKIHSSSLRIFTTIADYTNKKGETKLAHFTENGTYFGSIKQCGDKPVGYNGHFEIKKEHFEAYLPKDPKCITDFFRPRAPPLEEEEEEESEEAILRACSYQENSDSEEVEPLPVPKRKMTRPKKVSD